MNFDAVNLENKKSLSINGYKIIFLYYFEHIWKNLVFSI